MPDWYPRKREELPEWYQNFAKQLAELQMKYGITAGQLAEIDADNAWIQYWVPAMHEIEQQVDALAGEDGHFETILKQPEGTPGPSPAAVALPGGTPAQSAPGVRMRARDIANFIKGNPDYVVSDGELLGIVTPATAGTAEQIEVRSILMEKNEPVGNYSDIKTALIAP